jgi:drug/metabolite transporter (DMT)-like permease
MSDRLTAAQIALLCAYALGMTAGQILFKLASSSFAGSAPLPEKALSLLHNGFFLTAVVFYLLLTVAWVWILSFTPLSRAYPFVALAFAITPLVAGLSFGEALTPRLLIGIVVILCGLFLVAG